MKLREIFYKDIGRDIKGVIKVSQKDDENITQELEEYVVTNELSGYFKKFYDSYSKGVDGFTDKMGVWISGFFGSGKSHFLKILSYLLENKEVNNQEAINYFDDKLDNNEILNNIKKSGEVSTDVILFNIDSKSASNSKSEKDAIVKVFKKVFDDYLGYCGDIPWLAELERRMDKDGVYGDFKKAFASITGDSWEDRRHDFYYEEDAIIEALTETTKMSEETARNWYYNAENNYSLSVEKFAQLVEEYIEEQDDNHHVVFLVDEIGQYIGDDTQLMLNLQTVVEDLGTHCGGKAWVLVTSQQDIDSITKVRGGDFSKIQGRFDTRLSLSSANVDEVIKKRILLKKDSVSETLRLLYNDKSSILKNLITFSADTAEMKNYSNAEDFASVYPFVPYQFNLLQNVFNSIRLHGSSGKHLSEGERSLLSAFKESAQLYADGELGKLIPFSAFYNSIESFLDSTVSRVIIHAQNNDRLTEEDVEVLKVLFMIKYLDELPSNIENLTTLMVSNIDEDKLELKERIEASLKRLVKESLIQKNGPEYIFLTNEEQDVNKEIKNTKVDVGEVISKIGEITFEEVYANKKYRYNKKYDFGFNQIIDDKHRGRQREEIGVQILTYYSEYNGKSENELKLMSAGENNVIIKLPEKRDLIDEIEESLQLSTYLKKKGGTAQTETIENILNLKSRELRERQQRVKDMLVDNLGQADIYVRGEKLDIKSKDPVERINQGFNFLVESIYNKLNYISEFTESNRELADRLNKKNVELTLDNKVANHLAIDEVRTYIERQDVRNLKTNMKSLIDRFSAVPYGWKDPDIAGVVVDLFREQEIKLTYKNEVINKDNDRLIDYLTKGRYIEGLVINKRVKVDSRLINIAKELARDLFEITSLANDEDGLMEDMKRLMDSEIRELDRLLFNYSNKEKKYPGKENLKVGKRLLENICKIKDSLDFYQELERLEDELLDYVDDVEPIKNFFKTQKEHFDAAIKTLNIYQKNQSYVLDEKIKEIIKELRDIVDSEKPYSKIHLIPSLRDEFNNKFADLLDKEAKPVKDVIKADRQKVKDELDNASLAGDFAERLLTEFDRLLDRVDSANDIYEVIAMKEESDRMKLRQMNIIDAKVKAIEKASKEKEYKTNNKDISPQSNETPEAPQYKAKETKNVSLNNILHGAQIIESEEDIEEVVDVIRRTLKDELSEDVRVKLV